MRLNLRGVGSVAEVLASVAVVMSVVYLAQEISTTSSVISIERSSELYAGLDAVIFSHQKRTQPMLCAP